MDAWFVERFGDQRDGVKNELIRLFDNIQRHCRGVAVLRFLGGFSWFELMPARAQQGIAPVAESRLIKLFVDELNQQCPCPLNAFRQIARDPERPTQTRPAQVDWPGDCF